MKIPGANPKRGLGRCRPWRGLALFSHNRRVTALLGRRNYPNRIFVANKIAGINHTGGLWDWFIQRQHLIDPHNGIAAPLKVSQKAFQQQERLVLPL